MSDDLLKRHTETVGDFLRNELGIRKEELSREALEQMIEMLEETGLIPLVPGERLMEMRLELRHLHRSAAIIRRVKSALDLHAKEKADEK